jgi:hypothetical protein
VLQRMARTMLKEQLRTDGVAADGSGMQGGEALGVAGIADQGAASRRVQQPAQRHSLA